MNDTSRARAESDAANSGGGAAIAIVGMAGRFPGASDVRTLWRNLKSGVESIHRFTPGELEDAFSDDTRRSADFVAARGVLENVDEFDAEFFSMHAREAALTDPQHRVFLECCWEALEDAGCDPARFPGAIGCFAGAAYNSYLLKHVLGNRAAIDEYTSNFQVGSYQELLGSLSDLLATRVAYKLDLKGPAVNVQSCCSTSLLAVAQACQSLILFQSDMALAGGVSITFPQKRGYLALDGGMVSPDGHCRPFDAKAGGTVFSSGAGVVVLKRLDDALAAGDTIYAVIRGFGVNNDGAQKVGFTAPSADGQAAAIAAALAMADVDPASIGYVECHGTATPLGDPIEFKGLERAFGLARGAAPSCLLGSVKANLGHLDAAAGVTGLIKAALAVREGEIPPLINFTAPNPALGLEASPFAINSEIAPWPQKPTPRRAGVSSFGVGGTNVHVVIEEAPRLGAARPAGRSGSHHILPVSAHTAEGAAQMAADLAAHLEAEPARELRDVAVTLQTGRRAFAMRTAVAADTRETAIAKLRAVDALAVREAARAPNIVFMFPGQGAQYPGMGRALYDTEPLFKEWVERGARILEPLIGEDLRKLLYDDAPAEEAAPHPIRSTVLAQPALFVIEHAMAQLIIGLGAEPAAMIGHSLGEFVAACLAGVISYEDALKLVAARGRLMQAQAPGAMLGVRLPEAKLRELLPAGAEIAAVNAPSLSVASGPSAAIAALEAALDASEITHRRLHTSHAFHSAMMDPVVENLRAFATKIEFLPPQRPYVSSVTGAWVTPEEATSADYWARHCRECVRFAPALATILEGRDLVLLEVGPGRTLATFAGQVANKANVRATLTTLPEFAHRTDELADFASALAGLWREGVALDWAKIHDPSGRRVPLPAYRFQRKRHWVDPPPAEVAGVAPAPAAAQVAPVLEPAAAAGPVVVARVEETVAAVGDRKAEIEARIRAMLEELSGESLAGASAQATFLELGFDSLFLGQVVKRVQRQFGVKVNFRQLMREYPSIAALGEHIEKTAKPEALPAAPAPTPKPGAPVAAPAAPAVARTPAAAAPVSGGAGLEALFQNQMQAMQQLFAQQLQTLQTMSGGAPVQMPAPAMAPASTASPSPSTAQPSAVAAPESEEPAPPSRFSMYKPGAKSALDGLTPAQEDFVASLVAKWNKKTPGSKARTQASRAVLADPRSASGFRAEWKELVYPIVCARSKGSKIWDVDGNEFVDIVNGFGQTMFGHAPDFVVEAVAKQLQEGFPIGPQSPLAGEVAKLFAEMTGNERVTFCNTGSEAVMAAMRVARTVTARDKVVVFGGAYHGQFDEVLVRPHGGKANPGAAPVAPGIPDESVGNMIVLPYASRESLDWVRAHADDLAAVVAETVQSRHPSLQPKEFLAELRAITEASGTALIFDEVVTGFRAHPGGMQALFGIRADMATYGKVVGGGMPVGVLAGKRAFMDALDGGYWQYGDDSVPEVAPTFFAGTFVRHPLTLAACKAVLLHLKEQGPALQERLTARVGALVAEMNAELEKRGVKTRLETFSSWAYAAFSAEDPLASLLYAHMRYLGVHVLEGFPWFFTTAHSEADFARVKDAFVQSLDALQAAGILAPPSGGAIVTNGSGRAANDDRPREVRLTEAQTEVYLAAMVSAAASCAYNEGVSVTLEGVLDQDALAAALNDVVARHEALRGSIAPNGEMLLIAPRVEIALPLHDFSGPDGAVRLKSLLEEEARLPFDLAAGPLLRAHLVREAPERHVLVLTAHHIVCDGWSMNTVLSELGACYAARLERSSADLPEPLRFSAYAKERAASKADTAKAEAYWLGEYQDLPPPLELPTDRPRPAAKSFAGATYSDHLDAALVGAVKKAGQAQGATLFATLLAAVQVLLGKLGNETDIALTVPMAAQALLDDEILVGHAVDFLPVRGKFDASQPFSAHLAAMKGKLFEAIEHQSYTYGTLVRRLNMPRDPSRAPITDVQFNLERFGGDLEFANLKASPKSNPKAFVNFDLFLNLAETGSGIKIDVDYSTDLYDEATIRRWIGHLKTLLGAIARDPAQPIADMSLLSPDEERWLIETVNASDAEFPRGKTLDELIFDQAGRTPEAPAFQCKDQTLTYGELEKQASRVAGHLRTLLPAGGARVAVALPRTLDLPVALIAVLKSGNAYVPLDPAHPKARLAATIAAADVSALICSDDEMASLAGPGIMVVRADRPLPDGPAPPRARPDPASAAYVIFTSGSTGTPKGVEIAHRSVVNLLTSMAKVPGFTAADTIVAVTTISFDIAGLELFLPLIAGGRCIIADRDEVRDGGALARLVERTGATVLQATPSLWRMLLEAGLKTGPHLKMLCGGEALPRDLADRLLASGGELWNVYGPTETTIWSSAGRVLPGDGPIVIGAPVANTEFHILDADDHLVAPGVQGEVWIGGEGLARGYFNRPDLTDAAFRTISIGGTPRRLYRTGDVGRRLADGSIQLLGRRDHQIKLRGYRIELEDIEAHLRRAPGVAAAAAALQAEAQGDPRLVGYFVVSGPVEPTPQSLAAHLAEHLPAYMVPTLWQRLDRLPLTANGKLDRKSLPRVVAATAAAPSRAADADVAGVLETTVAEVWASLLGLEKVGADTNFFEAGGHSILAMRLMVRLQEALQRPMPVGDLYKYPRFGDFLMRLKSAAADGQTSKIIRIQPKGTRPPLIVLNNAWNLFPLSRALEEDRPLISIQFVDRTVSEPKNAVPFDEVVGEAISLIRAAQPKGPYALMGHCVLGSIALEAARRLKAEGEEVTLVAMLDSEPNCIFRGIPLTQRIANYWVIELRRLRWYFDLWIKGKVNIAHILARYSLARQLGLVRLTRALGLKERWPVEDFHTQHYVDAYFDFATRPYDGDVVLYRATPHEKPGLLERWLPWALPWKAIIKDRLVIEDVKTQHREIFREPAARTIGGHLSRLLASLEERHARL